MIQELLKINAYPDFNPQDDRSFIDKAVLVFTTYLLIFFAILLVAAPVILLTDKLVVQVLHFKSIHGQDKKGLDHFLKQMGYVMGLLYICLLGPVLEETVFRLPLSFKRTHIAISLSVAVLLFSGVLPFVKEMNNSMGIYWVFGIRVMISALLFFLFKHLVPASFNPGTKLRSGLIITSMILFGLMHISNYAPLQWPIIWIYPVYVLPQLLMGWGLTYMRFRNGFVWGIALHCLINSLSMLISLSYQEPLKAKINHTIISTKKPATDTGSQLKKK